MSWLRRVGGLFGRGRVEAELEEEVRAHLEMRAADVARGGTSEKEAGYEARRRFGNVALQMEKTREIDLFRWLETFAQDLRFGLRMLRKAPGFTAVAVLSLAIGIGANTAIFTLIDSVLMKMLPVRDPQQITLLHWTLPADGAFGYAHGVKQFTHNIWYDGDTWGENGKETAWSFPFSAFEQLRKQTEIFDGLFAFKELGNDVNVVADGEPELAHGEMASGEIFATLGLQPEAGRLFGESDDRVGAAPVCVISDGYWRRRFGADPNIAGKVIAVAGTPFTIVGVLPPGFYGLETGAFVDVWVPISQQPIVAPDIDRRVSLFTASDHWWVLIMARIKPGVSKTKAEAALNVAFTPLAMQSLRPGTAAIVPIPSVGLGPWGRGPDRVGREFSTPLFTLMGLVGLVLLIACANVANLLLARASARQREIAVRRAIGASRGRLIRQLLTESVLLASVGGVLGFLAAYWGAVMLAAMISPASNPVTLDARPDLRIFEFTAIVCIATGLLFGLAPAWRATRADLTPALKQGRRELGEGAARLGLGKALVISQVALSMVMLFGAGLFVRTLQALKHTDAGFDAQNILIFGLNPTKSGYKEAALNDYYARVQQSLEAVPGVLSATASYHRLLDGGSRGYSISVPGYVPKEGSRESIYVMPAAPDFLATMRIPLLRGRDIADRDRENSPNVVVVNQSFAKRYFAGMDPIGRHFFLNEDRGNTDVEVVGLVKDAKYDYLRNDAPPTAYQPIRQSEDIPFLYFEARTAMTPAAIVPAIRAAVAAVDPNVPMFDIKTQTQQIDELLLQERLFARLTSFFGFVAVALACIGLYGILSYAVSRRTKEIGIRLALGAQRRSVLRMISGENLLLVAIGIAIGIPGALAAGRLASAAISGTLYGVKSTDAATLAVAAALLAAVTLITGLLPAWRAMRVDPMVALRHE